jgi:hypothetical protein
MRLYAPEHLPAGERAMRRSSVITTIATTTALVAVAAGDADARLDLYIDKAVQQMSVIQNGRLLYVWPVSTARDRFSAPSGVYTPERLERTWFSRAYYNSPMPHAIFFHGGDAIHGSDDISKAGGLASRGCVRLHQSDAALLFSMVKLEGPENTVIFVGGDAGRPPPHYRNFGGPLLRQDGMAHAPYPPPGPPPPRGFAPYADGAGAYPPPEPPMMPYYPGSHVDGRGRFPPEADAVPYDDGEQYGDGRGVPRGPGMLPDYAVDPYGDGRGAPRGPGAPRDYSGDRYADRRGDAPGPGIAPDYAGDRYGEGRGAPRGPGAPPDRDGRYADRRGGLPDPRLPPGYSFEPYDGRGAPYGPNVAAPYPPPDHHRGGLGVDPRGPRPPPYASGVDASGQRRGGQLGTPSNSPASRAWAPHSGGVMPADRPSPNGWPPAKSGRIADRPPNGRAPGGVQGPGEQRFGLTPPPWSAAASMPPASGPSARLEPPPDRPPDIGYRVLPKSYWSGASWRWRAKRDDDPQ